VAVIRDGDELFLLDEENAEWNTGSIMLTDDEQQYKPARRKRHRCYLFHALCWNRVMDHFCPDELDLVSLHKALLFFSIKGVSNVLSYGFVGGKNI
jgi:hypothetical protein